ncbi:MAG: ABC transporter permease subunit [Bacteroidia bacterium]|nr:ABC transporter permease subunit [Bacteroidia bacterium]
MNRPFYSRLLWAPAVLLLLTWITFALGRAMKQDPAAASCGGLDPASSPQAFRECRTRKLKEYGLDLPVFYVSVSAWADQGIARLEPDPESQDAAARLLHRSGDWGAVEAWVAARHEAEALNEAPALPPGMAAARWRILYPLSRSSDPAALAQFADSLLLQDRLAGLPEDPARRLQASAARLIPGASRWKSYVPCIRWHGTRSQYHRWISGILLRGDLGRSFQNQDPVGKSLRDPMLRTLKFSLAALAASLAFGLLAGFLGARYAGSLADRILTQFILLLESVPAVWGATLLLIAMPVTGRTAAGLLDWRLEDVPPLLAYLYGGFGYLALALRTALLEETRKPWFRTALGKGLSFGQALWRHAMPQALLPWIALTGGIFPALVSGSVVIERIFTLYGMGWHMADAAAANDMMIVAGFALLNGLLSIAGYLIADWLHHALDPLIRYAHASAA